jgi:hypothetical protein
MLEIGIVFKRLQDAAAICGVTPRLSTWRCSVFKLVIETAALELHLCAWRSSFRQNEICLLHQHRSNILPLRYKNGCIDTHTAPKLQALSETQPMTKDKEHLKRRRSRKSTVPPLRDVLSPSLSSLVLPKIGRSDTKDTVAGSRHFVGIRRPNHLKPF